MYVWDAQGPKMGMENEWGPTNGTVRTKKTEGKAIHLTIEKDSSYGLNE